MFGHKTTKHWFLRATNCIKNNSMTRLLKSTRKLQRLMQKILLLPIILAMPYTKVKRLKRRKKCTKTLELAKEPAAKSRAGYNKGVSLTRQHKLLESIDAYKEALRLVPTDEEARQNLQKALNELKKQQQQQPKEDKKKDDKDKQKQKPNDLPENKSKLNQKQAEQMLNALRQEEKKLQRGVQKKTIQEVLIVKIGK